MEDLRRSMADSRHYFAILKELDTRLSFEYILKSTNFRCQLNIDRINGQVDNGSMPSNIEDGIKVRRLDIR